MGPVCGMRLADALRMGTDLLERHGLPEWRVVFDQAKTRAGVCRPRRRVIGLSAPLTRLHGEDEVRDTILHEIAHALVGPQHGHDRVWSARALEIGCTAMRCVSEDAPRVAGAWTGTCPAGHSVERHRRPERPMSCSRCAAGFNRAHVFEWLYHGRLVPMHSNYVAALRALDEGVTTRAIPVGARVRVVSPGRFQGTVGEVVKRGRTRYHVRVDAGVLGVPFSHVEALRP